MANSQNLCLFTGNLGKDPEIRYSQSGAAVANLSIALSSRRKKWRTIRRPHRMGQSCCVREACRSNPRLHKGSKIRVSTRVQTRKWQDQSGQDRYTTEFVIDDLELLTPKQEGQPAQQRQPEQRPAGRPAPEPEPAPEGAFEDDIPF